MFQVENILISEDLLEKKFVCNLEKCKGACCIEGTAGAPLDENEIEEIEKNLFQVTKNMSAEGLELLKNKGFYEKDTDGDVVTTCSKNGECVFANYDEKKHLYCAIQKTYREKNSDFEKPISCHLYPARILEKENYIAVNYHVWDICSAACSFGEELNIPVYKFLENPLRRKFGDEWYDKLLDIAEEYFKQKK